MNDFLICVQMAGNTGAVASKSACSPGDTADYIFFCDSIELFSDIFLEAWEVPIGVDLGLLRGDRVVVLLILRVRHNPAECGHARRHVHRHHREVAGGTALGCHLALF